MNNQQPVRRKPPFIVELEGMLGTKVFVKLKSGRVVVGTLKAFEPVHMNIVLVGAVELFEGSEQDHEKIIIRGDSIEYISTA